MDAAAADGLRAWAKGAYAAEAGVELLIRAFRGRFAHRDCAWVRPSDPTGRYWLDVATLLDYQGICSGGERRVLSVVAALVDGRPITDLGSTLAGLDRDSLLLVLAAMAHAAGAHEHSELVAQGDELVYRQLPAIMSWPAENRRAA
jgi:hypothetical protein